MYKLEEKLLELGYTHRYDSYRQRSEFFKSIKFSEYYIRITHRLDNNIITESEISTMYVITSQQDIDNLQQAFNQLQQDVELLADGTKE